MNNSFARSGKSLSKMACIFCDIVAKRSPAHVVWEDSKHLAFLSIFPNTKGVTVVIPKEHHSSDAFKLEESKFIDLTLATRTVGNILKSTFDSVNRVAMVYEGFGVDHVHAKLFPLHGTSMKSWKPIRSDINSFTEEYLGYVSTHDASRASDKELASLASLIRSHSQGDHDKN